VGELKHDLPQKVRAAANARVGLARPQPSAPTLVSPLVLSAGNATVIAIGASTGGTEAIREVLTSLPPNMPGILIVQHIPAGFSLAFAKRLNDLCQLRVKEAADGDRLTAGLVLIAPGNFHMTLGRTGGEYRVTIQDGPRVCYQRPSVDVLFESVAEVAKGDAIGAILTGMGSDGAQGLLKMKQAGARTLAQDEASCVVFGMPREAIRMGAADRVTPLDRVAAELTALSSTVVR